MFDIFLVASITVGIIFLCAVLACWKPYFFYRKIQKEVDEQACKFCNNILKGSKARSQSKGENSISFYWSVNCKECGKENKFKNSLPLEFAESTSN